MNEMEKIPYSKPLKALSDGEALFYILDNPIGFNTWLFVQHVAVEDETTNFDNIRIGRGTDITNVFWWEDRPVPAAGVVYNFDEMFFVPPGQRTIVRFDATTEGDQLRVWIDGYTTEKVITGRPDKPRDREE